MAGDHILVGSVLSDSSVGESTGQVYWLANCDDGWVQQDVIVPDEVADGGRFGESIGVRGATAIVGARHDDTTVPTSGAAYVYELAGGRWRMQTRIHPDSADRTSHFGSSVAIRDGEILVGSRHENVGDQRAAGAAYVVEKDNATYSVERRMVPENPAEWKYFGDTVAVTDQWTIIGGYASSLEGEQRGAVYVTP